MNCYVVLQSPVPQITSCYVNEVGGTVISAYVLLVVGETGLFHDTYVLTHSYDCIEIIGLMLYHSWKHYRESGYITPLVRILMTHNIFYYVCGLRE